MAQRWQMMCMLRDTLQGCREELVVFLPLQSSAEPPLWDRTDLTPGPGVTTMRWTLKRDIPQLLAQRRGKKKKINGLCIA